MWRHLKLSGSSSSEMKRRIVGLTSLTSKTACQGQDLIEYALMAGFVAVAVAAFIPYAVSGPITTIFTKIGSFLVTKGNA